MACTTSRALWEAFDVRAAAMLARAASASSSTAALSAALGIDPPMARDDFFRHVFSDVEDVRGAQAVICLRFQLLPVLLQRAVVSVLVMHAQRLSKSVLRYCSDRARAHVRDKVSRIYNCRNSPIAQQNTAHARMRVLAAHCWCILTYCRSATSPTWRCCLLLT